MLLLVLPAWQPLDFQSALGLVLRYFNSKSSGSTLPIIASLAAAELPVSAWAVAQTQVLQLEKQWKYFTSICSSTLFERYHAYTVQEPSWKQGLWYDIDGAVGWAWGGKDRCAPDDESCRNNGQVSDDIKVAPAPPTPEGLTVTDRYALYIITVRSSNSLIRSTLLRQFFGLHACPCCALTGLSVIMWVHACIVQFAAAVYQ
jgi:hypothetical protein